MNKLKILVTGANRGIGKGIVQRLLKEKNVAEIMITSRTEQHAEAAIKELQEENKNHIDLKYKTLDLLQDNSINSFIHQLNTESVIFDVIIMNAAMAYKSKDWEPRVRDDTLQVNYYGTMNLAEKLLKNGNLKKNGKMIFTSSSSGYLKRFEHCKEFYDELCNYKNKDFTEEKLNYIVDRFHKEVMDPEKSKNWPQSIYGSTKLFLNLGVHLLSRRYPDYKLYCFDPGYCKTDMTGWKGDKTAYEGGETAVYLTLNDVDDKYNGDYFRDNKPTAF